MEKLGKIVRVLGTGILGLTAELLERKGKLCLYLRNDGIYELFKVKIVEASTVFGKKYPKREVYPSNEDFGQIAYCFTDKKKAYAKYNKLCSGRQVRTP